jgi:hypothetical protein
MMRKQSEAGREETEAQVNPGHASLDEGGPQVPHSEREWGPVEPATW